MTFLAGKETSSHSVVKLVNTLESRAGQILVNYDFTFESVKLTNLVEVIYCIAGNFWRD